MRWSLYLIYCSLCLWYWVCRRWDLIFFLLHTPMLVVTVILLNWDCLLILLLPAHARIHSTVDPTEWHSIECGADCTAGCSCPSRTAVQRDAVLCYIGDRGDGCWWEKMASNSTILWLFQFLLFSVEIVIVYVYVCAVCYYATLRNETKANRRDSLE